MILGTKTRYAVMAMVDLTMRMRKCTEMKPVTLAEIAAAQEIPLNYLEQIFVRLRKASLVKSQKGPGGGYLLAKPEEDICISDIVAAVDESIKMTRCKSHQGGCMSDRAKCLTHDLWDGLGTQIYQEGQFLVYKGSMGKDLHLSIDERRHLISSHINRA